MSPMFLFLQSRISVVFIMAFDLLFLKLKYNLKRSLFTEFLFFLATGAVEYWYFLMNHNAHVPLYITFIEIIMIQTMPLVLSSYRDFRAFFVGFTASVYVMAGNISAAMMFTLGIEEFWCMLIQCVIHTLILIFLVWKIRNEFLESMDSEGIEWYKLCLIPAMFYAAMHALTVWPANIYVKPENLLGIYCVLISLFIAYVMILKLFSQMKREGELESNAAYLETYAARLKKEADMIQEKEMETAVLRHDLRHYSVLVASYLDAGKTEEIRDLLADIKERMEEVKPHRYCENLAANGVISYCADEAKKMGVHLATEVRIPQKLSINEFEFATVISNILENAVMAAGQVEEKEKRYVKITARIVKEQMILEISNSFKEKPEISPKTGLPVSGKGHGHGYGLQSVQAFVRKNNAVFDYSVENGIFAVRILAAV